MSVIHKIVLKAEVHNESNQNKITEKMLLSRYNYNIEFSILFREQVFHFLGKCSSPFVRFPNRLNGSGE